MHFEFLPTQKVIHYKTQHEKFVRGGPEIKQYDRFFLRWTWSFNRDFLEKFRPGRLIEQDAYLIESLEYISTLLF